MPAPRVAGRKIGSSTLLMATRAGIRAGPCWCVHRPARPPGKRERTRPCVFVGPIIGSGQNAGCGILPQLSPSLSRNFRSRDRHDAAQAYAAKLAGAQARNHAHTLR
jgi:hypothetical protein